MKKICTLLSLFLISTLIHGQSALSVDLGTGYPQVVDALDAKPIAHINYEVADQITVKTENYHVTYFFHNEVLYKTEMTITYTNQKSAEVTTTAMRNYYDMAQADVMELSSEKGHIRFAALHNREIHEVVQLALDRKTIQVRQMKMDLDRCPGSDLIELRDDEILFSMLYK